MLDRSGFDPVLLQLAAYLRFVEGLHPQAEVVHVAPLFTGGGAARATLVDRDTRPALGNVERLGLRDRAELVRADAEAWLAANDRPDGGRYDLVFVDAPYKLADLVARQLDTHLPGVLAPGGRAVIESGARRPLAIGTLERLRQRRYGAADVSIYALEDE